MLLFHRDLLGDAGGVLGIGLGHRPVIDGLAVERTDRLTEVEDVRRSGLLGSVLGRDPVNDVLAGGVTRYAETLALALLERALNRVEVTR